MTLCKHRLQQVFAPIVVGVPPTNAIRELMRLPSGELRHYGFRGSFAAQTIRNVYLSSTDNGFSWTEKISPKLSAGATVQSPWSGDYLTLIAHEGGRVTLEEFHSIREQCESPGLYLHRSSNGPDGPFTSTRVCELLPRMLVPRQPMALRCRKRWVLACHAAVHKDRMEQAAVVFLSDDDGASWRTVSLPLIDGPGLVWPHKGLRWQNCGAEPTVVELSDGRLYMLIRTAHDQYYESYSEDAGDSWSDPVPSRFYGTITTPLLFRLSDGRLLVFFNNTTPLPEADHRLDPQLISDEVNGIWEDVFTNRDVIHAAISDDDGRNWKGFRELHLNEIRNAIDFRSRGGSDVSIDKSVHQSQAVELPFGKVLLGFGQHPASARMLLFDPNWLLETDRSDDFTRGLCGWSVHSYLKSIGGGFRGIVGHCSLNRRPGPALVPHPDGIPVEVLQVARHPDPRLLEEREGAVWNFPAGESGRLTLKVCFPKGAQGTQIALVDRWFNPTDPVVGEFSQLVLCVDCAGRINGAEVLRHDCWHTLEIAWDVAACPAATLSVDGREALTLPVKLPTVNGISYLHIQSMANGTDPFGLLIASVEKTVLE